ncbi:unnamed protein product [Phyllotreta striolata]|uniref:Uncharacterized protein n=1 Tax=Phyllotreta striolata TaxID=444603 RepID=A0A9P0E024_PHYSR|nr:unnamed protein product [Phyllotreta striolata]
MGQPVWVTRKIAIASENIGHRTIQFE